jgi:hypothetical protein
MTRDLARGEIDGSAVAAPQPTADSHPLTRDLDSVQINEVLALHAGFLLRTAASAGPAADPNLVGMMVALGCASLRWLRKLL